MQNSIQLKVTGSLDVTVIPNQAHEFVMTTEQVAIGYGCSTETIHSHKRNHRDELQEGVHFESRIENFNSGKGGKTKRIYWTKVGVIRLGMFIMSERAKMFRDWIEQVVLNVMTEVKSTEISLPEVSKRRHNRLSQDRITDILRDVMEIEDKELRVRLTNKILNQ